MALCWMKAFICIATIWLFINGTKMLYPGRTLYRLKAPPTRRMFQLTYISAVHLNSGIDSEDMTAKSLWGFGLMSSWKNTNLKLSAYMEGGIKLVASMKAE